jgi:hypothetical protein
MSGLRERLAARLWLREAERVGPKSTIEGRTLEAFLESSADNQERWLSFADAVGELLADEQGENPVIKSGVREGMDEWHIECRFKDGQKYAAIRVDIEHEKLAHLISRLIAAAPDALRD